MTQHELIIQYCEEFGSILPAKQHGFPYKDGFLGSEASKRCRELRKQGILRSEREGKFERFYLGASYNGNIAPSKSEDRGSIPLAPAKFDVVKWNAQFYPKKEEVKTNQTLF